MKLIVTIIQSVLAFCFLIGNIHASKNSPQIGFRCIPSSPRRPITPTKKTPTTRPNKLEVQILDLIATINGFEEYPFELYEHKVEELVLLKTKLRGLVAKYIKASSMDVTHYLEKITEQHESQKAMAALRRSIQEDEDFVQDVRLELTTEEKSALKEKQRALRRLEKAYHAERIINITPALHLALKCFATRIT